MLQKTFLLLNNYTRICEMIVKFCSQIFIQRIKLHKELPLTLKQLATPLMLQTYVIRRGRIKKKR